MRAAVSGLNKYLNQGDIDLAVLNHHSQGSMPGHLGIRFTAIGPDFIIAEMPVDGRTRQPFGLLHGGASIVLAESLGGVASNLLAGFGTDTQAVGVEVSGSHLRGVRDGKVIGICRALKTGRSMHFWRIDIIDEQGQLICSARLTVHVSRRRPDA